MYKRQTLTRIDELSQIDDSKIPLEQQICLLKTTESVKEKAMQKLKEIKAKSEDSGAKSRQYLDGLLKIPFSIFKDNKVVKQYQDNIQTFKHFVEHMFSNYPEYSTKLTNNYLNNVTCTEILDNIDYVKKFLSKSIDKDIFNSENKVKILQYAKDIVKLSSGTNKLTKATVIKQICEDDDLKYKLFDKFSLLFLLDVTIQIH